MEHGWHGEYVHTLPSSPSPTFHAVAVAGVPGVPVPAHAQAQHQYQRQHITRNDPLPPPPHDDIPLRIADISVGHISTSDPKLARAAKSGPGISRETHAAAKPSRHTSTTTQQSSRKHIASSSTSHFLSPAEKHHPSVTHKRAADHELNHETTPADLLENCDRRRKRKPEEDDEDHSSLPTMSTQLVGKTVTPYLKEHIPGLYAPVAKSESLTEMVPTKNPNSKYCYRHRPDLKCRKAADENKMVLIQNSLEKLPSADQQAITHVWSLFSAAPAKHRELMLQGIITQCCFPQLSTVSREVHEQLKIDLLTAFPVEISFKILCYLDTVSLCKAAQVSRRWRELADDDTVWHRMCEQHIDRKCTKCGWGLPLLERKRLRDWTRQQQLAKSKTKQSSSASSSPPTIPAPLTLRSPSPPKRELSFEEEKDNQPKRQCLSRIGSGSSEPERKFRPFKDVYRDRFRIGYNWRHGKCAVKVLKGHTNGVTCLQLLDNLLATGSYDNSIKIWNIETGEEIRTLMGHTRGIRSLQFDDNKLISGSLDNTIKIWNWHTGELLSSLQCHSDGVISVHFDGEFLASGSIDNTVKVFNFETKETFSLRGHTDWVNSVRIDTESRTVFSASDDFKVKLWDLQTKKCVRTFACHTGHVQQVLLMPPDFKPDEELLQGNDLSMLSENGVNGSADGSGLGPARSPGSGSNHSSSSSTDANTAALRHPDHAASANSNHHQQQADDEERALRAAYGEAFVADPTRPLPRRYMLSGGLDSTIRLIDTATGRCLKTFFGHFEGIWGLAGDTLRAVTAANDGMVKVWEPTSGRCERTFTGHRGPVTCVSLSDSRMASGGEDGEVRLYCFHDSEGMSEYGTPS